MLLYRIPELESEEIDRRVYTDRITILGDHRGKITRAQLDIIRFVQTADDLINSFQEDNHAS